MKKRNLSVIQVLTIALIVLFLIWERNIQLYLGEHQLENSFATRKDLFVSLPILLVLVVLSIGQWGKNNTQ